MAGLHTRGFTIIEVMLFLSISGILFIGLMVGINASINQQRYRDSVTSFAGLLQQQYSEVVSTRNDRDKNWRCEASGGVTQNFENGQTRGTTDCVILGRFVRTIDGATKIETGDVIGTEPSTTTGLENDTTALAAYNPKVSTLGQTTQEPEWNALLRNRDGHSADFALLILRSPVSGLVRAFAIEGGIPSKLTDMLNADAARQKLITCIVPNGWNIMAVQAVMVDAATAGPNGVVTMGADSPC